VQEASNPTRVKVYGPALERPVKTNQPTYLIVDCSQAGPGPLIFTLVASSGKRNVTVWRPSVRPSVPSFL